jgi:two-component system sensor histidine kinase MprB
MSLRLRITLVVVLVVTAVVAVVGQRVYTAAERELVEEVDIELRGRAAGFVNVARGPQFREAFTPSALQDLAAEGFVERRGPRSFLEQAARENVSRVVAPNGEVIFNVGTSFSVDLAPADYPRGGDAPVLSDGSVDGGRARIATIAASDVFVQLARPLGEIDQSLDDLADRIVFISIIAIVVAAVAGWFISGGTIAPIRRLTDAAERVAETGDLEQPVDGSGGAEVGRLARSFNSMLEAL